MQAPVGVERQRGVRVPGVRPGDGEVGAGAIVELAPRRDHHVEGVVGAAQEHDEEPPVRLGRGPDPPGDERGGGGRECREEVASVHRFGVPQRMKSGEARNSVFQSCGLVA